MPWQVSIVIWGERFYPSRVPFTFTDQHDPGVVGSVGRYRGQPLPYGSASYVAPPSIPNTERIGHVVRTIEPILPAIREAGATRWHVSIGRYFAKQCNEDYSLEQLQLIARLGCGFAYSAYEVSEEEELALQKRYEQFGDLA